ncbi:MAG: P-loop NTPase [Bdellovibrionaceae bacterium]|jgi:hypothetical protein|nr:P-loop NTPase [Pseudobdellovibrionaceae bacterium]
MMEKQKILFVTGKGGVGKSAVAASLALSLSSEDKRVLLVEFGEESFYSDYLNLSGAGETRKLNDSVDIALWSGHGSLKRYIAHYLKLDKLVDMFVENKVMRALIGAAPGLKELSLLGRVTSGARNFGPPLHYDYIVVDAYATGHLLALLRAPVGMYEVIQYGPMGKQCAAINQVIADKSVCKFLIVTLAEDLPVEESIELSEALKIEFNASPEIIVNKYNPLVAEDKAYAHFTSEFIKDTRAQLEKQKKCLDKLEKYNKDYSVLPFEFEINGKSLVHILQNKLEEKCKNLLKNIK